MNLVMVARIHVAGAHRVDFERGIGFGEGEEGAFGLALDPPEEEGKDGRSGGGAFAGDVDEVEAGGERGERRRGS